MQPTSVVPRAMPRCVGFSWVYGRHASALVVYLWCVLALRSFGSPHVCMRHRSSVRCLRLASSEAFLGVAPECFARDMRCCVAVAASSSQYQRLD